MLSTMFSAVLGSVIGGGAVGTVGYLALRAKLAADLSGTFASTAALAAVASDLNHVVGRVTGAISMASMTKDTADQNSDRLTRLEEQSTAERGAFSRTLTRIDQTLVAIDSRQRDDRSQIDRTASLLDEIQRRLERANH